MYTISKEYSFSAAHHLPHLPVGHPCRRPHGHNYVVRVEASSASLDSRSFVVDYADLDAIGDLIDERLDHRDLNEVLDVPTTAENLAEWLYAMARIVVGPAITAVAVSETPKTWATYRP